MENVIKIKDLDKAYKIYGNNFDRLLESLPFVGAKHKQFYALKNITFDVAKGEVVGIVGKNGAGKSTLLKIITGVSHATNGELEVKGKIASLLELGTGFDPELTGTENVYFQGHLMGFTKEEIDKKYPEIIEFADIGDFIEQPVKNYSSGMFARLAFSTAINVEPDILLVDEVLSVGDLRFQLKCLRKIEELGEQGKTILFVSHDTNSIARYCNRVIWIKDHEIFLDGPTDTIIPKYRDYMIFGEVIEKKKQANLAQSIQPEGNEWINIREKDAEFIGERIVACNRLKVETFVGTYINPEEALFKYTIELESLHKNVDDLFISTLITNENSYPLAHHGTSFKYVWKENEVLQLEVSFAMPPLKNGEYAMSIDIGDISSGDFELSLKLNNIFIFSVDRNEPVYEGDGSMRLDNYTVTPL